MYKITLASFCQMMYIYFQLNTGARMPSRLRSAFNIEEES